MTTRITQDLLEPYYTMEELGSWRPFQAPYSVIQEVANKEGLDLTVAQNFAPRLGAFLEMLRPVGDKVTFLGYRIFPPREDAAVVIEGFIYKGPIDRHMQTKVIPKVRDANEFQLHANYLRVWYD